MQMFDAVNPDNIPADAPAVAGYMDGAVSEWPANAWDKWHVPMLRITVLANDNGQAFDNEQGDAPASEIASAVSAKIEREEWAVVYTSRDNYSTIVGTLASKGLRFADASQWPKPGVYLWAADWTNVAHLTVSWASITPVACQWTSGNTYDTSELAPGFLENQGEDIPMVASFTLGEPQVVAPGITEQAFTMELRGADGWGKAEWPGGYVIGVVMAAFPPDTDGYRPVPAFAGVSPNGELVFGPGPFGPAPDGEYSGRVIYGPTPTSAPKE